MTHALAETAPLDFAAAEAFAGRIGDIVNSGAIAVMISVGHKTGLFDLMATLPASTSQDIADAAGLNERYVREWLAVMVTGGIVLYDAAARSYRLPEDHAACLTRGAPLGNFAVYAQFVPMVGATQERIIECFKTGDGTHYGDYPCFHAIMAEDSEQTVVAQLADTILPLVDGMRERLEAGIDVLDAGCGSGRALVALAQAFPRSRFTGYDLCEDAIASARAAAQKAGVENVRFEVRDLTGFDEKERYDFITSFDAIHDQKDPQGLLNGIFGALRPGGAYLVQDIGGSAALENNIDFPFAAFLYTASCAHCTPISLGQGGPGLGTMWGWETAEAMLREAGFETVDRHVLEHDPMNVWFVARRD
jgi:SAM-dependent methyltransferase